ncbi:MAG: radical SAM protein [Bacteroidota bacterium]
MNWSKYNYEFESDKYGAMLYNSFSNSFIRITPEIKLQLQKIKDNPEELSFCSDKLQKIIIDMKILVNETSEDLINTIKLNSFLNKSSSKSKGFTIAPTLDCNFKCEYCFEISKGNNKPKYMSLQVENAIAKSIISDYSANKCKYSISWYGGEPLLAMDSIERITNELINNSVDFSASMVTNGYLLNKENIEKIKQFKISFIQVTIDGDKEEHNKKRAHKTNADSYEMVISNIDSFYKETEDINLSIRINIDKANYENYHKYVKELSERFPKAHIYPALVTDFGGSEGCYDSESCALNKKEEIAFYLSQYENHNNTNFNFFPHLTGITSCAATNLYGWVIGPEGDLYKCWNDIGDENKCIGNIKDNKITNITLLGRYLVGVNPTDDKMCKECFYLPICGGGCPYQRLENKYFDKKIDCCVIQKGKTLERFLEIQYEISKKNSEKISEDAVNSNT